MSKQVSALPNIVIIVADDLGAGDLRTYHQSSLIPMPVIERLSAEGMRFTNAYCPDAVCTPSRYALMTGRYSWRTNRTRGVQLNWEPPMIEEGRQTLPGLLQKAGYLTGGFGKWHLGAEYPTSDGLPPIGQFHQRNPADGQNLDLSQPLRQGPMDRGFNHWFGFICASESLVYEQRNAVAAIDVYPLPKAPGAEELEKVPLKDYLALVTDKAISFIQEADRSKPMFLFYSPYVPHVPLAVPDAFKGSTKAGDYGDYVAALDHHTGRLLEELNKQGFDDNTLIIFVSDNGSQFETTGEGHRPNAPLRGKKAEVFEGGVRTPLLVRWPGVVRQGSTSNQLVALTDLIATVAAITGHPLPPGTAEDSFSFLSVLQEKENPSELRSDLVVKGAAAHFGLRSGPWKYIAEPGYPISNEAQESPPPALYKLSTDPGETNNVIDDCAEIAAQLRSRLASITAAKSSRPRL